MSKDSLTLLHHIKSPQDLRRLSIDQLSVVADECRRVIIDTVSRTGGHLASNLGVVELTIALHYAFNTPFDQLIWDVGHQIYTHKILTGRLDAFFNSLRQYEGLSGFPKRSESVYDHYDTGHSGTSISFALGLAEAELFTKKENKILAVIGDGSMTAGMAFEALNQSGQLKNPNLIVVLNDNEMSISPNVGALAEYISRRMISYRATQLRKTVKNILNAIPRAGADLIRMIQKLERSIKDLIQPGLLFEELGFQYLGPFDGHRVDGLVEVFQNVQKMPGPLLIHVLTKKGLGYKPAEKEPEAFHGASPFDLKTGEFVKKTTLPSYTSVFGKAMVDLALKDERIVAITAAMTLGTGLKTFANHFPDRFYDVGIAEQHAVTFAAGLVQGGMRPVVAIYSSFLQRAYDQVFHDVCLQNLPVIMALDRGGLVGADGPTHHGIFDLSYLRHLPGLIVIAPRDENMLRCALFSAVIYNKPIAIRYPRGEGVGVTIEENPRAMELGTGEILRKGRDVTIVAVGPIVYDALQAASELGKQNIDVEVIDARFVKPLDSSLILESIRKTRRLLTLEENTLLGGFGSAVIEMLVGHSIKLDSIDTMGIPDAFIGMGDKTQLYDEVGLSVSEIIRRIKLLLSNSESIHNSSRRILDSSINHGLHSSRRTDSSSKKS
ncbi:1-deoxy-D-xylulose-5-phosphate synthase [bacterium]|nr:1-deoxy-D-xylulose-5-phosphate synthase [candidate division CSSED10-310 bacterium]